MTVRRSLERTPRSSVGSSRVRYHRGSVAFVTGGASGIGRALCEVLAESGGHVVIADRQVDLARRVVEQIRHQGGDARSVELDVTDFDSFDDHLQRTRARYGRLDMVFNNAGIGVGGETQLYRLDDWHRTIDVHVRGVANGVHAAYPLMLEQGFGHIVNTASIAGLIPGPGLVAHTAAKHAIFGLSTSLRIEAAAHGLRVSTLCPGVVQTPMIVDGGRYGRIVQPLPAGFEQWITSALRPIEPRDFARRVVAQASRNKGIMIIPARWRAVWLLQRFSPSLSAALVGYAFRKAKAALDREHSSPTAETGRDPDRV